MFSSHRWSTHWFLEPHTYRFTSHTHCIATSIVQHQVSLNWMDIWILLLWLRRHPYRQVAGAQGYLHLWTHPKLLSPPSFPFSSFLAWTIKGIGLWSCRGLGRSHFAFHELNFTNDLYYAVSAYRNCGVIEMKPSLQNQSIRPACWFGKFVSMNYCCCLLMRAAPVEVAASANNSHTHIFITFLPFLLY